MHPKRDALRPERVIRLSISAAIATMGLKLAAFVMTGSVALLSDALESIVNLVAAGVAWWALRVAARPADAGHPHGHEKAELLSSALEAGLVLAAAVAIAWAGVSRLGAPRAIESVGLGTVVSGVAGMINGVVAAVLLRVARQTGSVALEADGRHLLTDVRTTVAALVGVGLVELTGIAALDPLVAIAIAGHVAWTAVTMLRGTVGGLMDEAMPGAEQARLTSILEAHRSDEVTWHGLRTRQAGRRAYGSVHLLVPGAWSVRRAHDLVERIESEVASLPSPVDLVVHVEPREDPRAWADEGPGDVRPPAVGDA